MVQKELGQKTQALAILLVAFAADLEDGDGLFAVDFIARRMVPHTLGCVTFELKKIFGRITFLPKDWMPNQ
jgi:hypothetical protein